MMEVSIYQKLILDQTEFLVPFQKEAKQVLIQTSIGDFTFIQNPPSSPDNLQKKLKEMLLLSCYMPEDDKLAFQMINQTSNEKLLISLIENLRDRDFISFEEFCNMLLGIH